MAKARLTDGTRHPSTSWQPMVQGHVAEVGLKCKRLTRTTRWIHKLTAEPCPSRRSPAAARYSPPRRSAAGLTRRRTSSAPPPGERRGLRGTGREQEEA